MKTKIHQSLIIIGLSIVIVCSVVLSTPHTNYTSSFTENESMISSSSMGTNLSPFFTHLEEDMDLYLQLNNTIDSYDADFFYHTFTNNPDFTITDNSQYASDLIYFLMGLGDKANINFDTIDYTGTPLWDTVNGGFYSQMDSTLTTVAESKTVFNNLLYILALLEGANKVSDQAALANKIKNQWDATTAEFWDTTNGGFNHSNADLDERYSTDNFLGAIVAFTIGRTSIFTQSFRNQTAQYGKDIMTSFASNMYDGISGEESYYNTSDLVNNKIGTDTKYLLTNALGIISLLEWNIFNGYVFNSSSVQQAEDIWRFLNTNFFDGLDQLYITVTSEDGATPQDSNMHLLLNAWMLKVSLDLFKQTGNTTYYEAALDNFYGIEQNLYDEINSGYNSRQGTTEKSIDGYGMLLYSLEDFYEIFTQSEIVIAFNQTEYLYQIDPTLNFTLSYNITMEIDYYSVDGSWESWDISAPINNADINYVLRYTENNSIVSIDTSTTNGTGQDVFLYDLSTLSSLYDYTLDVRCNRTGFNVGIALIEFPLTAGIEIVEITQLYDTLHQDDTVNLNITYTSSRPDDINASTKTSGENFIPQTSDKKIIQREDEIDGKLESWVIVNLTARDDAELGSQLLDIVVLNNNSEPIFQEQISLEIYSAVEVTSVLVSQYMVNFSPTFLRFTFKNHRSTSNESISIELNGTAFEYSNTGVEDIAPLTEKSAIVSLIPNEYAKLGTLKFSITIKRNDTIIFDQVFSIQAVPEIEIVSIESQNLQFIQGQTPTVAVRLRNYGSSSNTVGIYSNGIHIMNKSVAPGESHFLVELGKTIRNPYNIGEEVYELIIKDSSGNILATKIITVDIKPSTLNVFLFYVLPILIPIGVIVFFKYKELEQIKRTK